MLQFYLKSFDHSSLKLSLDKLSKIFQSYPGKIKYLPTERKKFTVLTSPHIDKKSRDQFEIRYYKVGFSVCLPEQSKIKIPYFLSLIKVSEFPGVELKARVKWTGYFTL